MDVLISDYTRSTKDFSLASEDSHSFLCGKDCSSLALLNIK